MSAKAIFLTGISESLRGSGLPKVTPYKSIWQEEPEAAIPAITSSPKPTSSLLPPSPGTSSGRLSAEIPPAAQPEDKQLAPIAEFEVYFDYQTCFRLYKSRRGAVTAKGMVFQLAESLHDRSFAGDDETSSPSLIKQFSHVDQCLREAFEFRARILDRNAERTAIIPILGISCRLIEEGSAGLLPKIEPLFLDYLHFGVGVVVSPSLLSLAGANSQLVPKSSTSVGVLVETGPAARFRPQKYSSGTTTIYEGPHLFSISAGNCMPATLGMAGIYRAKLVGEDASTWIIWDISRLKEVLANLSRLPGLSVIGQGYDIIAVSNKAGTYLGQCVHQVASYFIGLQQQEGNNEGVYLTQGLEKELELGFTQPEGPLFRLIVGKKELLPATSTSRKLEGGSASPSPPLSDDNSRHQLELTQVIPLQPPMAASASPVEEEELPLVEWGEKGEPMLFLAGPQVVPTPVCVSTPDPRIDVLEKKLEGMMSLLQTLTTTKPVEVPSPVVVIPESPSSPLPGEISPSKQEAPAEKKKSIPPPKAVTSAAKKPTTPSPPKAKKSSAVPAKPAPSRSSSSSASTKKAAEKVKKPSQEKENPSPKLRSFLDDDDDDEDDDGVTFDLDEVAVESD